MHQGLERCFSIIADVTPDRNFFRGVDRSPWFGVFTGGLKNPVVFLFTMLGMTEYIALCDSNVLG